MLLVYVHTHLGCKAHRTTPPRQASRLPHRPIRASRATVAARHMDTAACALVIALAATIAHAAASSTAPLNRAYEDGPRYGLAIADVLITLVSWLHTGRSRIRTLPTVESWLYATTVVFLVLMIIYSATRTSMSVSPSAPLCPALWQYSGRPSTCGVAPTRRGCKQSTLGGACGR